MNFIQKSILLACLMPMAVAGQKQLTLEDVVSGGLNYRQLVPVRTIAAFDSHSKNILIVKGQQLVMQPVGDTVSTTVLSLPAINTQLEKQGLSALTNLRNYRQQGCDFWFNVRNVYVKVERGTSQIADTIMLPANAANIDFVENSNAFAYTIDNSLWIRMGHAAPVCVQKSVNEGIQYGQTVHRNEFGIKKGTYWNTDASRLAFYKQDESMVTSYPVVDYMNRVAVDKPIKYPMAGMTSHKVEIGIFDIATNQTIYLQMGDVTNRYFTNLSWLPDGKSILVAELNRAQNKMELKCYDAISGQLKSVLFTETSDKWVEPENPALFVPFMSNCFIWQSSRNGFNHLYLFDTNGKLLRQLTDGQWDVTGILGFNAKEKSVIFEAAAPSPLERQIYKVSLTNGNMTQLTSESGYHQATSSGDGRYLIDYYTNATNPGVTQVVDSKGKAGRVIGRAENPLKDYFIPQIRLAELKADDGSTLYGRIVLPKNFDATKKYPVVVYVYGGPHAQLVSNSWLYSAQLWQVYMAQKGYISFTLDNCGTPFRGRAFEQVIHRQLGINECNDQMKGIDYLKSLPYVDSNRIGVHGWSFGGHMTTALMLRHPEVFKVGVAGGPVMDWKYYEVMYGERYMDTPDENPEGYLNSNLIEQAGNLQGKLLIIHGGVDPVVVLQHSMLFIESCIKKGKQVDYFIYPTHEHNVIGHDRVHLMEKVTQYFDNNL